MTVEHLLCACIKRKSVFRKPIPPERTGTTSMHTRQVCNGVEKRGKSLSPLPLVFPHTMDAFM